MNTNPHNSSDDDIVVPSQFEESTPNNFEGCGGREECIVPDNEQQLEQLDGLEVEMEKEEEEIEDQEIITVSSGSESDSSSEVSEDASSLDLSVVRSIAVAMSRFVNGKGKKKTSSKKSPAQT